MSNARTKSRNPATKGRENSRSDATKAPGARPPFPLAKPKDDLRSKLLKYKGLYESLATVSDSHRFRVIAEVLPSGEDYIQISFGCVIPGVLEIPWREYPATGLEVTYGPKLAMAQRVMTMSRRSLDRLGVSYTPAQALGLDGTEDGKYLLMSNSEYGKLSASTRLGRANPASQGSSLGRGIGRHGLPNPTLGSGSRRWSDEMDEVAPHLTPPASVAPRATTSGGGSPPYHGGGVSTANHLAPPGPGLPAGTMVPLPTTANSRAAPLPSTVATRSVPAPTTQGGV
jgi:hypothetical protein